MQHWKTWMQDSFESKRTPCVTKLEVRTHTSVPLLFSPWPFHSTVFLASLSYTFIPMSLAQKELSFVDEWDFIVWLFAVF